MKAKLTLAPGAGFLPGMFSLLDSLLDQSLESIMDEMPIEEEVKLALTQGKGVLGQLLNLTKAYEHAQWDTVTQIAQQLKLSDEDIAACYDEAVKWTADLFTASA